MRAKHLGTSSGAARYRLAIFIEICILAPIYAALRIAQITVDDVDINGIISIGVTSIELITALTIFIGTITFIIIVLKWLQRVTKVRFSPSPSSKHPILTKGLPLSLTLSRILTQTLTLTLTLNPLLNQISP